MIRKTGIFWIFFAVLIVQGCAVIRPARYGPEAAVYANGGLAVTYADSVNRTFEAARDALKDFDISITSTQRDPTGGIIRGTGKDGAGVSVALKAKGPDTTTAVIRVGRSGDEGLSRAIARRTDSRLKLE